MPESAASLLTAWENFYVIIGSAAAALTGLQFVVMTLIAGAQARRSSEAINAFGTPTVVHFCSALLVAAIVSAPWPVRFMAGVLIGLCGFGGVAYTILVMRRTRRQQDYQPVREDWLWYVILPLVSYLALVVAGIVLFGEPEPALYGIGAVALLLLFIGIHNAWDTVIYIAVEYKPENKHQDE